MNRMPCFRIAAAGPLEQLGPRVRIELLRGELRDKVLVTERGGMAVGLDVVFVLRRSLAIHVVGIPGAVRTAGGNRVDPPMRVDPELGVLEPLRRCMPPEPPPAPLEGSCHVALTILRHGSRSSRAALRAGRGHARDDRAAASSVVRPIGMAERRIALHPYGCDSSSCTTS